MNPSGLGRSAMKGIRNVREAVSRHGFLAGSITVLLVTAVAYSTQLAYLWTCGIARIPNGDGLATAAALVSVSDTPFFDINEHLDENFSQWPGPMLGLFTSFTTRLLAPLDLNGAQLLAAAAVTAMLLTAWTFYAVATSLVRSRVLAVVLAIALALSPFLLGRSSAHLGVMACFLPVAAIGAIISSPNHRRFLVLTLVLGILASPWWQAATPVLIVAVLVVAIVAQNREVAFRAFRTGLVLIPGVVVSVLLSIGFPKESGLAPTRQAWDSNYYGGHFMDVIANAPLVEHLRGINAKELAPGFSWESSGVGSVAPFFILIVLCFCAIAMLRRDPVTAGASPDSTDSDLTTGPSNESGTADPSGELSALHIVAVATVTTFVAGGFGNLQAGLAVILNSESPARVWSRFSIIIAFVAGIYAMRLLRSAPRPLVAALLVATLAFAAGDYALMTKGEPDPTTRDFNLTTSQVSAFAASGCTIVQVPVAGFPAVRIGSARGANNFYYEEFRPYLTYPQLKWTAGGPLLKDGIPLHVLVPEKVRQNPSSKYCGFLINWDYYRYLKREKLLTDSEQAFFDHMPMSEKRYSFHAL